MDTFDPVLLAWAAVLLPIFIMLGFFGRHNPKASERFVYGLTALVSGLVWFFCEDFMTWVVAQYVVSIGAWLLYPPPARENV